jgi:ribonuclease HII
MTGATKAEPRFRTVATQAEERRLWESGFVQVAGVDEVGRGPLAGPVVAGAVILPDLKGSRARDLDLIQDSKSLTERQRERGDSVVRGIALAIGIGEVSSAQIDEIGIMPATKLAMRIALDQLDPPPDHLLVDGKVGIDWHLRPCTPIVKGDLLCSAVAAASVVAKVYRDALMRAYDERYPGYGLGGHKGYASASHLAAIAALGPSPQHRRSFSPMRPLLFAADA